MGKKYKNLAFDGQKKKKHSQFKIVIQVYKCMNVPEVVVSCVVLRLPAAEIVVFAPFWASPGPPDW